MERVRITSPIGELTCLVRSDVLVGVAFDGDAGGTVEKVRRRFAGEVVRDAREAGGVRAAFEGYFGGDPLALDALAVDPGGTPFQVKVWMSLREIEAGQTRSYQDVARRVGSPAAVRAVGAANGANPIPLVLPCHRVIGKNGTLVGYGGGMERKTWLLRHEGALGRASPGAGD